MNARILFAVLLLFMAVAGCKKDNDEPNQPAPSDKISDEGFKNFLLEQFDANRDGVLDDNEANAVREIVCEGAPRAFTSLQGIEIFPNLEKLILGSMANVNSLDFSKHIKLKELHIYDLPLLQILNTSSNTDLEIIYCNGSFISSLDVTNNVNLKELTGSVLMKFLDLSNNVNLEKLVIPSSELESVDLSKNTKLKILDIGYSQFDNLDLSHNTELREVYFNNPYEQSLKKLDILNCTKLEVLSCQFVGAATLNISRNVALKKLILKGISLTYMDLSQNENLEYFDFSDTRISNAFDFRHTNIDTILCNSSIQSINAKGSKTLKMVEFPHDGISLIDLSESSVEEIVFTYKGFTGPPSATFILNDCPNLKQFNYGDNRNSWDGNLVIEANNCKSLELFQANYLKDIQIKNCPKLKELFCTGIFETLDLSGNKNLEQIECFAINTLRNIDISTCEKLKDLSCIGFFEDIDFSGNKSIETITLQSGNLKNLQMEGLQSLKYLEANIYYSGDEINIKNNVALETVMIGAGNPDGIFLPFSLYLSNLPELKKVTAYGFGMESLDISDCRKLLEISNSQYVYNTLKSLELVNCPSITTIKAGNSELVDVDVSHCPDIDTLILNDNQLTSLTLSKNISYLDCSANKLMSLNVSGNIGLQYFNCSQNPIESLAMVNCTTLSALDCSNTKLTTLDLHKNQLIDKLICDENALLTDLILYTKYSFSTFKVDSHTKITYDE